jgi:hypothetical protein
VNNIAGLWWATGDNAATRSAPNSSLLAQAERPPTTLLATQASTREFNIAGEPTFQHFPSWLRVGSPQDQRQRCNGHASRLEQQHLPRPA